MADGSRIEWTDSSWNPIVGCSIVSKGCQHCYAQSMAGRIEHMQADSHYAGTTHKSKVGSVWTGKIAAAPDKVWTAPLRWTKPRRVFVNSMGDLFHEDVPDAWVDRAFAVMALAQQHTFQVLTKRSARMRAYCSDPGTPFRVAKAMDEMTSIMGQCGEEELRPVEGFPGYLASSFGYIYSDMRGERRRMRPDVGEQGHSRVQLHREGSGPRGERVLVHRLILETFVGPPPSADTQGKHKDGNPEHNAVANLQWGDQPSNWADSKRHGTHRRYAKLSEAQATAIRSRHADGETGEALSREFDVSATQIRNIAAGRQWNVGPPIRWPLDNVWKGVSAEDQQRADERIPDLLATPAAVRWVSAEPLLGPVDLSRFMWPVVGWWKSHHRSYAEAKAAGAECGLKRQALVWAGSAFVHWVVVGGESGPGARPMHPQWARDIRNQCAAAGVAFHFKQRGAWTWIDDGQPLPWLPTQAGGARIIRPDGSARLDGHQSGEDDAVFLVGKARAGRLLDGVEHNGMPA